MRIEVLRRSTSDGESAIKRALSDSIHSPFLPRTARALLAEMPAAPCARLRSAFSAPPAKILPCGSVRLRSPESRPVPPRMHSGSPPEGSWERPPARLFVPRAVRGRKGEQNHESEASHLESITLRVRRTRHDQQRAFVPNPYRPVQADAVQTVHPGLSHRTGPRTDAQSRAPQIGSQFR